MTIKINNPNQTYSLHVICTFNFPINKIVQILVFFSNYTNLINRVLLNIYQLYSVLILR